MASIYVPRAFGGTLILIPSVPQNPTPAAVNATARDGLVTGQGRDGKVNANSRDGLVIGTGR